MSKLAQEILLKNGNPPIVEFLKRPKTLFELLNVQKLKAYKYKVQPIQWYRKGFEGCYYEVHRTKYKLFNNQPTHGNAWAILYWRGKPAFHPPKEVKGGLKFAWQAYRSPEADGIAYDAKLAASIEKKRYFLLKGYYTGMQDVKD
ncbi:hypothetical protein GGI23_001379 [Coemansia sp. RSA 2559]|nr:hypothetical protein GGI23_001379 [Coemansia sp. RSA 2559]KAJ2867648.1 hypothetical protein GGI22_001017 [Coemansia erecta]